MKIKYTDFRITVFQRAKTEYLFHLKQIWELGIIIFLL